MCYIQGPVFTKPGLPTEPHWAISSPKVFAIMVAGSPGKCYDFQLLVNKTPDIHQVYTAQIYISLSYVHGNVKNWLVYT